MNNTVAYSVLKYSHSKILGEELNVGLLFFNPKEQKIEFLYPQSLNRLKRTYPDVSLDLIKKYLYAFKSRAEILNDFETAYADIESFIQEHFIVFDDSSLQFTKPSFVFSDTDENLSKHHYYDLFLGYYHKLKTNVFRLRSSTEIIKKYKKLIVQLSPETEKYISFKPKEVTYNKVRLSTDLQWQNGTLNLIKGVSFDQKDEYKITEKALLLQNQLNYLSDEIDKLHAKVDLLLIKPQSETLLESYKYAVDILKDNKANIEVFEESQLLHYAQKLISTVERN